METGKHSANAGFTLVEVAIVLLVIGVALGGLLGAVGQSAENTRRIEAKNKLREIEEALYAFAQVRGRLPCPANNANGSEVVNGGNTATGQCTNPHGLLPNTTLGLTGAVDSNGLLMDPWGNPYRYSVATTTPGGFRYTGTNGINSIYASPQSEVVTSSNMLTVCSDSDDGEGCSAGSVTLTNIAPALVLTMGKNWGELGLTSSTNEQVNAYDGILGTYQVTDSNFFVVTDYSEENFDDMLIWISPHLLFSKMIQAGWTPP